MPVQRILYPPSTSDTSSNRSNGIRNAIQTAISNACLSRFSSSAAPILSYRIRSTHTPRRKSE